MAATMQSRIILIDELRGEIKAYGISKLAREVGYSRKHVQRIASGQRQPSAKFLAAVGYKPIVVYKELPDESTAPPNQAA